MVFKYTFTGEKLAIIATIIKTLNVIYKSKFCIEYTDCCKRNCKKISSELANELTTVIIDTFRIYCEQYHNIYATDDDYKPYLYRIKESLSFCPKGLISVITDMMTTFVLNGILVLTLE